MFPVALLMSLDSGHGGQMRDSDGDEVEGHDESEWWRSRVRPTIDDSAVIFPLDFEKKGVGIITDDASERNP